MLFFVPNYGTSRALGTINTFGIAELARTLFLTPDIEAETRRLATEALIKFMAKSNSCLLTDQGVMD